MSRVCWRYATPAFNRSYYQVQFTLWDYNGIPLPGEW
jgi:hypothetical protein